MHAQKARNPDVKALCMLQQEVVGEGTDVMEMSEGVFAEALADYPGMELAWLQMLYDKAMRDAENNPAPLSMQSVLLPSLSGFSRSKVLPTPFPSPHHTPPTILQCWWLPDGHPPVVSYCNTTHIPCRMVA